MSTCREMVSDEERKKIAELSGYRLSRYGEGETHAICIHGILAQKDESFHSCVWMPLVIGEGNVSDTSIDKDELYEHVREILTDCMLPDKKVLIAAFKAADKRMERNALKCESYSQKVVDDCDEFEKQYAALRQEEGRKNG